MKKSILKLVIDKHDAISFDIFDTLIERTVDRPTDIFRLVEKNLKAAGFCQKRLDAELKARQKKQNAEISLDDIYEQLDSYSYDFLAQLKDAEIALEIDACSNKKEINEIYDYVVHSGKKIFIISDMYLPENVISQILNNCNIHGYAKLYISNVCGVDKKSSLLFKYVLQENHLKGNQLLHIGDSIKADFLGAIKAGVHAYLVHRKNRLGRLLAR